MGMSREDILETVTLLLDENEEDLISDRKGRDRHDKNAECQKNVSGVRF